MLPKPLFIKYGKLDRSPEASINYNKLDISGFGLVESTSSAWTDWEWLWPSMRTFWLRMNPSQQVSRLQESTQKRWTSARADPRASNTSVRYTSEPALRKLSLSNLFRPTVLNSWPFVRGWRVESKRERKKQRCSLSHGQETQVHLNAFGVAKNNQKPRASKQSFISHGKIFIS